jgi:hypothetical protein
VAEPVFDVKDLAKALDKVLAKEITETDRKAHEEKVEKFLEEFAQRKDGSGMEEVVNCILEIIDKDGPGKKGPVKEE